MGSNPVMGLAQWYTHGAHSRNPKAHDGGQKGPGQQRPFRSSGLVAVYIYLLLCSSLRAFWSSNLLLFLALEFLYVPRL